MPRTGKSYCRLALLLTLGSVVVASGQHLAFDLSTGQVSYREKVSIEPTESEWDSPFLGFGVLWTSPEWTSSGLTLRGGASFRGSSTEDETWTSRGTVVQRNEMQLQDLAVLAEVGLPVYRGRSTVLNVFAGLRYGNQRFIRDDFRVADLPGVVTARVDEVFDMGSATLALDLSVAVSEGISLFADGTMGYVFIYEADNSAFGKVDGDDGTTLDLDAGVRWALEDDQQVAFSLLYSFQDLNGNVEPRRAEGPDGSFQVGVVELPDNELEYIGLRVSWSILL